MKYLTVKIKGTRDIFNVLGLIGTYGHGQLKKKSVYKHLSIVTRQLWFENTTGKRSHRPSSLKKAQ